MNDIRRLTADELLASAEEFGSLLVDTVDSGASVGFLAPLDHAAATAWWTAVAPGVAAGGTVVWAARVDGRIAGTVQIRFEDKENGRHRAEVVKLLVHRDARGRGLGRELLAVAERGAVEAGVRLLLLDTVTGSPADSLYRSAGWTPFGTVPGYAADTKGVPEPTTFFYKAV
ncbi:GNAT family N-acetyltransferase [Saccharopolyspora taberi]|uniref:GNAT family N-acetyltransferase n=1 Tax=Saccharopolyspora taberi TaxID=60895 RepID=A0ABN3VDN7_9PSEU